MQQHINGNGNVQAGGNIGSVVMDSRTKFSPHNPHAVKCPHCGEVAGRYSEQCMQCNYRVKAHFDRRDDEAQRTRFRTFGVASGGIAFSLLYAAQHWLAHTSFSITLTVTGFGGLLIAAMCFKGSRDF